MPNKPTLSWTGSPCSSNNNPTTITLPKAPANSTTKPDPAGGIAPGPGQPENNHASPQEDVDIEEAETVGGTDTWGGFNSV
jgi:hypothetical protein